MTLIKHKLFAPINIYSLVFIRIAFGFLMFCNSVDYFIDNVIDSYFVHPEFLFKFYGFEWVTPLPQLWMHLLFFIMSILGIFIMIGLFYRTSTFLFLLCFTYVFLLEKVLYLNHYYMAMIVGFLLCFMPANRFLSVDALYLDSRIKTKTIPAWAVILLKIQMEIILIYAGIVKINSDWLNLYPLKFWFQGHGEFFSNIYVIAIGSYGSIAIHIIGAPLLFFKRTRIWAFLMYAIFHSVNAYIFNVQIGIFPWLTLAMTTIFFAPNWPLQFANFCKNFWNLPNFSAKKIAQIFKNSINLKSEITPIKNYYSHKKNIIFFLIIIWCAFQILFPLRKYLYEGNPSWHQQGHYFSWQMKLNQMDVGHIVYNIKDNVTGEFLHDDVGKFAKSSAHTSYHLTRRQMIGLGCKPDLHLQYAKYLKKVWRQETGHDVSVYATVPCSLNGRKFTNLIDPNVDLSIIEEDFSNPKWILPLDENLKPGEIK